VGEIEETRRCRLIAPRAAIYYLSQRELAFLLAPRARDDPAESPARTPSWDGNVEVRRRSKPLCPHLHTIAVAFDLTRSFRRLRISSSFSPFFASFALNGEQRAR